MVYRKRSERGGGGGGVTIGKLARINSNQAITFYRVRPAPPGHKACSLSSTGFRLLWNPKDIKWSLDLLEALLFGVKCLKSLFYFKL